jgi:hypothetical protein
VVTSTGSYMPRRWMSSLRASNSSGGRSGRTWYMGGGAVVPIGGMAVVPGDAGIAVSILARPVSSARLPVLWFGSIDTLMGNNFQTFTEFLRLRDGDRRATDPTLPVPCGDMVEPTTSDDPTHPGRSVDRDQVSERSRFSGLFKGLFKVVNPARPASPTNSRLLASPFKRKLKSQVMGK